MKKKVAVLGATGSIGKSTLDILRSEKDCLEPVLFSSHTNCDELQKLKKEFPAALTALSSAKESDRAFNGAADFFGHAGLLEAIHAAGADITVNGIAGAAGLEPSLAVINSGSDLALANKETIVMAAHIVKDLATRKGVNIIPVDSEHSAVFKLFESHGAGNINEIILTASGGPFRNHTQEQLRDVKPEDALAHPTWSMGPKITVDSASMANKGLEVIEAAGLFGFSAEKIKVTIHPQSIVHSLVRLNNGAVYAQMSKPDMRLPIHDALFWPETKKSSHGNLDLDSLVLNFEKCDFDRFPMLALAYEALGSGPKFPAVYNAANEVAVEAFLDGKIAFLEIPRIVRYALSNYAGEDDFNDIEAVLAVDSESRKLAAAYIENRS